MLRSIYHHSVSFRREAAGSVTLAKSNAKALLTLRIKSALRSPRGIQGAALLTAVSHPAELPFEKVTLHPA